MQSKRTIQVQATTACAGGTAAVQSQRILCRERQELLGDKRLTPEALTLRHTPFADCNSGADEYGSKGGSRHDGYVAKRYGMKGGRGLPADWEKPDRRHETLATAIKCKHETQHSAGNPAQSREIGEARRGRSDTR